MFRVLGFIVAVLLVIVLFGPLIIPIPPLKNTRPPQELGDTDSLFIEVDGIQVHYKDAGSGQTTYLLLHGFPASLFSWREVIAPLAKMGRVIAFDRPGFGLTERPLKWNGVNPYSLEGQVDLTIGIMDRLGIEQAVLVGNSAGGTVALWTAILHPERVKALILVDAAVYSGAPTLPSWQKLLLSTPQADRLGPLFVRSVQKWGLDLGRSAWHDPSKLTDAIWAGYTLPLQAQDWDKALWEITIAPRLTGLSDMLSEVHVPTLVMSGDDDQIVPTGQSVRLAKDLPGSELVIVPNCGHIPQEESPQEFLKAVQDFVNKLTTDS